MLVKLGIWVSKNDRHVYGDGRQALLEEIDRLGSIRKAANEMGMSYRAAWGKIKASEEGLGIRLLERTIGGRTGGGATLTDEARRLMTAYADFRLGLDDLVNDRFAKRLEAHDLVL